MAASPPGLSRGQRRKGGNWWSKTTGKQDSGAPPSTPSPLVQRSPEEGPLSGGAWVINTPPNSEPSDNVEEAVSSKDPGQQPPPTSDSQNSGPQSMTTSQSSQQTAFPWPAQAGWTMLPPPSAYTGGGSLFGNPKPGPPSNTGVGNEGRQGDIATSGPSHFVISSPTAPAAQQQISPSTVQSPVWSQSPPPGLPLQTSRGTQDFSEQGQSAQGDP